MYYNWFTHDFMTEASRYELATFAGTFACKVTKINENRSVVQFDVSQGIEYVILTFNDKIFDTEKEALEAAKEIIKGNIETLQKSVQILDEDIADENNIS